MVYTGSTGPPMSCSISNCRRMALERSSHARNSAGGSSRNDLLQSSERRLSGYVVGGGAENVEEALGLLVLVTEDIQTVGATCRAPEQQRPADAWTTDHCNENRLKSPFLYAGIEVLDRNDFKLHVDTDVIELLLNLKSNTFVYVEVLRNQTGEAKSSVGFR